eukprot:18023-Heterococcus_DN1.PRE.9
MSAVHFNELHHMKNTAALSYFAVFTCRVHVHCVPALMSLAAVFHSSNASPSASSGSDGSVYIEYNSIV